MYCIFSVLKPLTCGRQSRCQGWTYKLPGGQKFSFKLSHLSVGFPQNKKTGVYKLPRGAIYKPPCVQLINIPFFAIHQVFARSILTSKSVWPAAAASAPRDADGTASATAMWQTSGNREPHVARPVKA